MDEKKTNHNEHNFGLSSPSCSSTALKAFARMYFGSSKSDPVHSQNSGNFLLIGYAWHSWTSLSTANAVDSSTSGKLEKLSSSATPSLTKSRRLKRPVPLIPVPPIFNLVTSEPNDRRFQAPNYSNTPPFPGSESSVTSGLSGRSK